MRAAPIIATSRGTRSEAFGPLEWALLAAIAGMWGSSFIFIDIGLEAFHPGLITLARIGLGAAALSLFPRTRRPVAREDWGRIVVLGLVWMAVPLTLFPVAQQWIDSSVAGMVNGAMPMFSALVAAVLLRAAPGIRQGAGLAVGFAGVVLVTLPATGGASASALGIGLLLFATFLYGLAANLTVPLQQKYGALPVVFRAQLVAAVAVLPWGIAQIPGSRFAWASALSMVSLGILSTGLAYVAMATLVGRSGATRGAVAIYFIPVVATALGVGLRSESVEVGQLVGMGLVIAGAYLTSRRESRVRAPSVALQPEPR